MKKIVLSIIAIILLIIILGLIKYLVFGNDDIIIADYMPTGLSHGDTSNFPKTALRMTQGISMLLFLVNILLTIAVRSIFIKKNVFEQKKDYLLTLAIAIIPVIPIAIQLYYQMGYTW